MDGPPPDLDLRDRVAGSNTTDPRTRERKEAETRRSSGRGAENRRPGEPGSDHQRLLERDGPGSARVAADGRSLALLVDGFLHRGRKIGADGSVLEIEEEVALDSV